MNLVIAAVLSFGALSGVGEGSVQANARWVFDTNPGMELWFHGMATVDPQGPGPNALYDLSYPDRMREVKGEMGVFPTALDRSAGRLSTAFRRDPAFEVLHFLPLYFAQAGRVEMFDALKALAVLPAGTPRAQSPRVSMGLRALAAVLPSAEQRQLLGEFVAALEAEWEGFFGDYHRSGLAGRDETRVSVQELWDEVFHPALSPYLAQGPLAGGSVALCSSLGTEGRVFAGIPEDMRDNVMAVRELGGPAGPRGVAYMVLRELSYSEARQALEERGFLGGGRQEVEAIVSLGAVWTGSILLEQALPEESIGYKKFFLAQAGSAPSDDGVDEAFEGAFPLDAAAKAALREAIVTRTPTGGSS